MGLDDSGMQFVAVEFDSWSEGSFDPDSSLPAHIGIDSSVHGNVARIAVPRFNGSDDSDPRYAWVDYDGVVDQFDVFFSGSPEKPNEPTLTASLDLQSIFEDSPSLWAGWTAANGEQTWNTHAVQDFAISTSAELAFEAESINLSDFVSELQAGANVLAIHGLNASVEDDDFLIKTTLTATQSNRLDLDSPGYLDPIRKGLMEGETPSSRSKVSAWTVTERRFTPPSIT